MGGNVHDSIYSLNFYARFSGQFFLTFSQSKIVMGQQIVAPRLDVIETFSIRVFMGNRKQQFAVMRLQFRVAGISNFSKKFIVQCRHAVFQQVEVHHFYRPKNRNNSSSRVTKSNKHIADGYKKILRAFKREAVELLVAKRLSVSHLPFVALPAVQT